MLASSAVSVTASTFAVRADGFLADGPEDILEQLKALENRYPGLAGSFVRRRSAPRSSAVVAQVRDAGSRPLVGRARRPRPSPYMPRREPVSAIT
jgi:hypothetical protein